MLFPVAWETDNGMCGIIGVSGVPDAVRQVYLGLYSLQHRGQEPAGVVAWEGAGAARSHGGMGLVSDFSSEQVIANLPGDVAIGHTRYSTAGSSVLANAQPMLVGYREGPLALAHNGNLTNAVELRSDLVAKGSIFQTSSDSEVLVHLVARSEAREPEDQLLDALERVEGAYSLVVTIGRTLYAIMDPRGFRPLVLGRLGSGWVVASETCALDILGATPARDLEPGHVIRTVQAWRTAKVKIKFNPVRAVLEGKKVVVVDDSIVRGTTSRALVQLIRQAGAKEVHFRVGSPPITGPCYYGIDTPSKKELIASSNSIEGIRQHLGVDTLGYLSLDGMLRAAGGDPGEVCHACFSGDYPTEIPEDLERARHAAPLLAALPT